MRSRKPKVPVYAIATANHPMIRFIGHREIEANLPFSVLGYINYPRGLPKVSSLI